MPQQGRGALYAIKATGDSAFVNIGNITNIDGPNITVGEVETTDLTSTFKPYQPTIKEGELSFDLQHSYGDAGVTKIKTLLTVPIPTVHHQITYSDGYIDTWDGFFKAYSITGIENETIIMANVSVRMVTDVTSTAPA